MKLIHTGYNLEITLQENRINVLSVENSQAYARILCDLWNQVQGGEGEFILSEHEKIKNIAKEIECIFNPFALDCNDKKILGKLYQELKEQGALLLSNESASLNTVTMEYLDKLLMKVPYALEYNFEFDIVSLLKVYGVKIQNTGNTLLERIVEYLKVMNQICSIKNFVFVGLKQYLANEELEQLYKFVFYEKINLIIIEAIHSEHIQGERCCIFDKDLCIIEL